MSIGFVEAVFYALFICILEPFSVKFTALVLITQKGLIALFMSLLNNIRIVLVNTSHPGNIGGAARAMKTMGVSQLYLVQPNDFPSAEATSRASGADNILAGAVICDELSSALKGCAHVIGTTARERSISLPVHTPKQMSEFVKQSLSEDTEGDIAIVFGRESSGLSNDEVDCCQSLVSIDSSPDFSSLNLAASVQVMCYELRCALLEHSALHAQTKAIKHELDQLANFESREHFFEHTQAVIEQLGFFGTSNPELVMRRLRYMYERAQLTQREINILRGIYSAVQNQLSFPPEK